MYKWPQFQTCLLCPCETTVSLTQLLCTLRSTVSVSGSEAKRVKIQSIKHIMLSPGGRIRIMKVVGCGAVLAGFIILGNPLHLAMVPTAGLTLVLVQLVPIDYDISQSWARVIYFCRLIASCNLLPTRHRGVFSIFFHESLLFSVIFFLMRRNKFTASYILFHRRHGRIVPFWRLSLTLLLAVKLHPSVSPILYYR